MPLEDKSINENTFGARGPNSNEKLPVYQVEVEKKDYANQVNEDF